MFFIIANIKSNLSFHQENVEDQIRNMTRQLRNEHNWLNGIEKSLCSQQTLSEDPDELLEQIKLSKVGYF